MAGFQVPCTVALLVRLVPQGQEDRELQQKSKFH